MNTYYNEHLETYKTMWHQMNGMVPLSRTTFSPLSSLKKTFRFIKLKRQLKGAFKTIIRNPQSLLASNENLIDLISLWLNIDAAYLNERVRGDYIQSTESFIKRVKARWPDMDDLSVFQALRNVWIMNTIQIMTDMPIALTDAMFAYSMLYPLTDNFMDDASITPSEKQLFNAAFKKRLQGESVLPLSDNEADVFEMISLIEKQYPREHYPEVYDSLLGIHAAQCNSLKQQSCTLKPLELLHVTFDKGASSVVADGYLVLGKLSPSHIQFLVGYGIVLQLADDLQDLNEDTMMGHHTLFTDAHASTDRWLATSKLMFLSTYVLSHIPTHCDVIRQHLTRLLNRSMTVLILDAMFEQRQLFTRQMLQHVEKDQPISLKHHARLKAISQKWVHRLKGIEKELFQI